MSVQALSWAFAAKTGSAIRKMVLIAIANYADEAGVCWPSQKQLAADTELSRHSILRALRDLEDANLITRECRYSENGYRTSDRITLRLSSAQQRSQEQRSSELCSYQVEKKDPLATAIKNHQGTVRRSSSNNTRVRADFYPSQKVLSRCRDELGMSLQDIEDEHLSFMDYFNRDGPKYRHSNWDHTFWNWCKRSKRNGSEGRRPSMATNIAEIREAIERRLADEGGESSQGDGETFEQLPRLRQGT